VKNKPAKPAPQKAKEYAAADATRSMFGTHRATTTVAMKGKR
jgi:hypothetical protein